MQKNVNKTVFTHTFIEKFNKVIIKLYNYEKYMDFMIVPSIFNTKTLSYLPLLNYTDRTNKDIDDLLSLSKDTDFNIRVLNFDYNNFKTNDTVTMRLDIEDKNSDEIFKSSIKRKCRTKIRKSYNNKFVCNIGNTQKDINDFYDIFSQTMHLHGTPVLDKKLFIYLVQEFNDNILFFNSYDENKIISTFCILFDKEIAWSAWGGIDSNYKNKLAGYFTQWESIKYICDNKNVKIYDFGRSPYGIGTYNYKNQFGTYSVKIDIISSNKDDIYSKYSLASSIWKKMPKSFTDTLGPKLCKYLVDL